MAQDAEALQKPALDVDLATLLPLLVQQLMLGKGKGKAFVAEQVITPDHPLRWPLMASDGPSDGPSDGL